MRADARPRALQRDRVGPVAVASRCCLLLPGPLTVVSIGPTPVHVTSKETWCVPPRMSLAIPDPVAVTLLRFSVLVMVAGAVGAAQLNEVPSRQTARNCTLAVGSASSVSGASKSRVLRTKSVPCTVEPSAHSCGTAQKASAVSSKKSVLSADAEVENASAAPSVASATTTQCRGTEVVLNMFDPPRLMRLCCRFPYGQYDCAGKADSSNLGPRFAVAADWPARVGVAVEAP